MSEPDPRSLRVIVAENVRAIRRGRDWTQAQLADRLRDLGHPMDQATVAKLEKGARNVSVEDAAALAVAFNVSLIAVLLPHDVNADVVLTGNVTARTLAVRRWVCGRQPLPGQAEADYFQAGPDLDRYMSRDPHLFPLMERVEREALGALGYEHMSNEQRMAWTYEADAIGQEAFLERNEGNLP